LQVAAVKIVDDMPFAGFNIVMKFSISEFQAKYELGTVVHGPSTFMFFGLSISQDEDTCITIDGDHNSTG